MYQSKLSDDLLLNTGLNSESFSSSPMCWNGMKLLTRADEQGGITLTKAGYFNRKFVTWAVEEFQWLGYEPEQLYRVNKVLNEYDVPPISDMHDLMFCANFLRRIKGKAVLTKKGREIRENYSVLQAELFEAWFLRYDFDVGERDALRNLSPHLDYHHALRVVSNRATDWVMLNEFAGWIMPTEWLEHRGLGSSFDVCLFVL